MKPDIAFATTEALNRNNVAVRSARIAAVLFVAAAASLMVIAVPDPSASALASAHHDVLFLLVLILFGRIEAGGTVDLVLSLPIGINEMVLAACLFFRGVDLSVGS